MRSLAALLLNWRWLNATQTSERGAAVPPWPPCISLSDRRCFISGPGTRRRHLLITTALLPLFIALAFDLRLRGLNDRARASYVVYQDLETHAATETAKTSGW